MILFIVCWLIFIIYTFWALEPIDSDEYLMCAGAMFIEAMLALLFALMISSLILMISPTVRGECIETIEVSDIESNGDSILYREATQAGTQRRNTEVERREIPLTKEEISTSNCSIVLLPEGEKEYIEVYATDVKYNWVRGLVINLDYYPNEYIIYANADTYKELTGEEV